MPRLSHAIQTNFVFFAKESGGDIGVVYNGDSSFVRAELHVKVQKRFLLVFWSDVSEWSGTSTERYGSFSHTFALDGSGMYRAVFTLKIYGTDGTYDLVEETIESKY